MHNLNFLLSESRLNRIALAIILAVVLAVVTSLVKDRDHRSLINSGDFPGFYAMAYLIEHGEADKLYSAARQREIENTIWPWFEGDYYFGAYPPYVAILASPLAKLDGVTAARLWVVFSFIFFIVSLRLSISTSNVAREKFPPTFAALLIFAPAFIGVFGGQNTALSMLLASASIFLVSKAARSGSKLLEVASGVPLGLWMVKPQYGGIALAVLLFAGHWRILLGGALGAALLYVLAIPTFGLLWPLPWLEVIGKFSAQNYLANFQEQVSIPGTLNAVAAKYGTCCSWLRWAGFAFAIGVLVFLVRELHLVKRAARSKERQEQLIDLLYLLCVIMPLISPQALFYDLGISALGSLRFLRLQTGKDLMGVALFLILSFCAVFIRGSFPLPFLSLITLVIFCFCLRRKFQAN